MTLTTAERSLLRALLAHYRLSLLKQLSGPHQLTAEGVTRYRADINIAEALDVKLRENRAAA